MGLSKAEIAANEAKKNAEKAIELILDGKMITVTKNGKSEQKQPSDAIQRCFAGAPGKDAAKIVIARAKAEGEEGEKLRAALEKDSIDIYEWEEAMNGSDD